MLEVKRDVNQQDSVKSELFHEIDVVNHVRETQIQMGENCT